MAPDDLVELGVVRGAYGVKGWVRVAPFARDGAVLESVRRWWLMRDSPPQMLIVDEARRHGASIVAKWQQCDSKEAADAFKGAAIAVARSDFPPLPRGEHYLIDVVGMRVVNREGIELGTVCGLRSSDRTDGATIQWLEVSSQNADKTGKNSKMTDLLIPLNDRYADEIDTAARLIRVDWHPDW